MELDEKVDAKNDSAVTSGSKSDANDSKSNLIRYPNFDVNKYASNYQGKTLIDRLLHIADLCPDAKSAALQRALQESEKGIDVDLYSRVSDIASKHFGGMINYLLFPNIIIKINKLKNRKCSSKYILDAKTNTR